MRVEDVITRKRELEEEITKMVEEFNRTTDTKVTGVSITENLMIGKELRPKVKLEVTL